MENQAMPYFTPNKKKERGNAIFIILVLIALLAALTAVTMRSSQRTNSNVDNETARMQAEKLMRQAKSIESGVAKVMSVNGCSENNVNFVNATTTRVYTNANSPADKSCDVYDMAGAGLTYFNPDSGALDTTLSALADYGQWVFTGTHCVLGLGSDDNNTCANAEVALIAIVPHVNLNTCLQVNNLVGITNPSSAPPTEVLDETSTTFTGTFTASADPELGEGGGANLVNHDTGCFKNTSGAWANSYVFYHVLVAR